MVEVQVKAASNSGNPSWIFGAKGVEPARSPHEWFVLVVLPAKAWDAPNSYVVPRDHIAAGFWISFTEWFAKPRTRTTPLKTTLASARTFHDVFAAYENRWDLLRNPADEAPVLLPSSFRALALSARVGLPPNHPWRATLPVW